ncbi:MAG: hypothetical protein KJ907_10910 [Actinobacteria bacterium]|nr:hypothetical protein [Actinomycetota bacterium]MBU4403226.1 hypothetical protein [Actinomycetota bacterium]
MEAVADIAANRDNAIRAFRIIAFVCLGVFILSLACALALAGLKFSRGVPGQTSKEQAATVESQGVMPEAGGQDVAVSQCQASSTSTNGQVATSGSMTLNLSGGGIDGTYVVEFSSRDQGTETISVIDNAGNQVTDPILLAVVEVVLTSSVGTAVCFQVDDMIGGT